MAGALEIHVEPVVSRLDGMARRAADLTKAWPEVGRVWAEREGKIFASAGPGWAPLSSKSLMAPRTGGPLVRTGALRDALTSATPRRSGPRFAVFGPADGADVRGGLFAKRGGHAPKRDPVPPLRPAEKKEMLDAMAKAVLGPAAGAA